MSTVRSLILCTVACAMIGCPAQAVVRRVPAEYPTIQDAIDACSSGDVVEIAGGRYSGPKNSALDLGDLEITLDGLSPGNTFLDCQGERVGMTIAGSQGRACVINDLVIENGNPHAVVIRDSSPTFNNCRFVAAAEDGVVSERSAPLFRFCRFSGNGGAGVVATDTRAGAGPVLEQNSTIEDNRGEPDGGGILCSGTSITLEQCVVRGNRTSGAGGGLYLLFSTALVRGSTFESNEAGAEGGGIYSNSSSLTATSVNRIEGNVAVTGGGIYLRYGQATLEGVISGNVASGEGGGIACDQAVIAVSASTISRNGAARGGGFAIYAGRAGTMTETILWGNCSASAERDAFIEAGGGVAFDCCNLDQQAIGGGGGITYRGDQVLDDPRFCAMGSCEDLPNAAADLFLAVDSPCVEGPCGSRIGALEEACAETAALLRSWGAIRASFR